MPRPRFSQSFISNNAAERAIRPVAIGRKNWLFAGSDDGGERAAIIYTLIETAKMNGIEPESCLRAVIGRIADHPMKQIDELLPWKIGAWQHRHVARYLALDGYRRGVHYRGESCGSLKE